MKLFRIFCILVTMIFSTIGCAYVRVPKQIPPIGLGIIGPYTEKLSVDLINNQPDSALHVYAGQGGFTCSANYNQWTNFFIEKLAEELKKRNTVVSKDSQNKLKVKLSDFAFIQGFWKVRVNMKIKLEMPDKNWEKEWVATDTSGWNDGRAFGSVIYNVILGLLKDHEFIEKLNAR